MVLPLALDRAAPPISFPNGLKRLFHFIIFDWDGTAVEDRRAPAEALDAVLEPLLRAGPTVAIITGTNVFNLLNQAMSGLSVEAKRALYLCTNRGSEVYAFDPNGELKLLYRKSATRAENQGLDDSIQRLADYVAGYDLKTAIISNRLNRRKLDLIPVAPWLDPKKSELPALYSAVQERILRARIPGGFQELMSHALHFAQEAGLKDPRVTSDLKHIEVGLTDKSDSVRWLYENLIRPAGTSPEDVAILGDEFAGIGGVAGSDAFMRIPELTGATFASVGAETGGAPAWVTPLGGGPPRFVEFLEDQLRRWREPTPDRAWLLEQEGFDPTQEREMETLFAIGNGHIGIRASTDFLIPASQSDLFVAGIYDRKIPEIPYSELKLFSSLKRESRYTELVAFPFPFQLELKVDGSPLRPEGPELIDHSRKLDLRHGIYFQNYCFIDKLGRKLCVRTLRCASMVDPHLLLHEIEIACENFSGSIEGRVLMEHGDLELSHPHLRRLDATRSPPLAELHLFETSASGYCYCLSSRQEVNGNEPGDNAFTLAASPGKIFRIRRYISIFAGHESPTNLQVKSYAHLEQKSWSSFESDLSSHRSAWLEFWNQADVLLEGRAELQQALRFNLYHLRIPADHDPRVSIGARALTGRAYEGHIFWDTEIFIFPFCLYTDPGIARSLLLYRYHTLDGARKRARNLGYLGACYAWESTHTGEDVTPTALLLRDSGKVIPIFTGSQQIHVTADVAYAVWRYWDATLDEEFLAEYGTEILAETARFWTSRATADTTGLHLRGVIGPDEYHISVDDNAYTNWMARFNLEKAVWAVQWLRTRDLDRYRALARRIEFRDEEPDAWRNTARQLVGPRVSAQGVLEQFDGFFNLKEFTLSKSDHHRSPLRRLFDWQEVNLLRLIKQADVLMIPFLFPDAFSPEQLLANFRYYEPLTDHGSSLSLCVHAALAARAGLHDQAREFWEQSLNYDLQNRMKNTSLGIHVGCMGGTWQALAFHILGIRFTERGLELEHDPTAVLPEGWQSLSLNLTYRGKTYPLRYEPRRRVAA